jgi:hypothetical protein
MKYDKYDTGMGGDFDYSDTDDNVVSGVVEFMLEKESERLPTTKADLPFGVRPSYARVHNS